MYCLKVNIAIFLSVIFLVNNHRVLTVNGSDAACLNEGGKCQNIARTCWGEYKSNLCDGPRERMCCVGSWFTTTTKTTSETFTPYR
ncbi:lysozyme 1-like [Saccostrea echinata]|uniref:lysozyme 1-like n=1 Tax=Saccostrea echinata TaxID=191078 RepID=UPI002A83AAB3|nr:lysozyme 1-like [Saccostrea echinata]